MQFLKSQTLLFLVYYNSKLNTYIKIISWSPRKKILSCVLSGMK